MKQRVRDAQILSDGFSWKYLDLIIAVLARNWAQGDVKEFSPHSMSNIFHYAPIFIMGVIPIFIEFSASRVLQRLRRTKTLEELVDGGIFQQVY